jgi:hypothetical protein
MDWTLLLMDDVLAFFAVVPNSHYRPVPKRALVI